MNQIDKLLLGHNVKVLREAIGISQHDFSVLLDISKRSLASIELGEANIGLDLLSKIASFFSLSFEELASDDLKIKNNFREQIIESFSGKEAYLAILNKTPNLTYAINFNLLKTKFLEKPREVNEIKKFFENFGWYYLGTSISNALKREKGKIKIEAHPNKKSTFLYSKNNLKNK